jgi:4-hydroxythreonine-4-phosphate dehydrogenase
MSAPVAITMGDAAGVGPEIVARLFDAGHVRADPGAIVVGDAGAMRRALALVGSTLAVHPIDEPERAELRDNAIDVLTVGDVPPDLPFGRIDARAGDASYRAVCHAIDLALAGRVTAIVTAPVNKESLHLGGAAHADHTSLLADRSGAERHAMMLVGGGLWVALVTTHVSLAGALGLLTVERELEVIRLVDAELRRLGTATPRIAVAGVNPHAGEHGLFGDEEARVVEPAIAIARDEGIEVSGPHPADTLFHRAHRNEFDAVVAQYHDQGLIPVKLVGFEEGVNVTLGLPFVRTSVDHGTAFDIAGTGTASPDSLRSAFDLALVMVAARQRTGAARNE